MCGFLCVFDPSGVMHHQPEVLVPAGRRLTHRGPDDEGVYVDDFFGVHVRRLSILDPTPAGHQPMVSDEGGLVVAFNGEIYNYAELRSFLEGRGHVLQSGCDTEVLLRMYQELGNDCVARLRGMFAFAVWNTRQRELVLIRDRLGIKPLYMLRDDGRTIVASEIKAILDFVSRRPSINARSVFKYLARGWVDDAADTFYAGIEALPAASLTRIAADGTTTTLRYWSLEAGDARPFDPEEFRAGFFDTVAAHLQSDVPVAALLSGGMDTSAIVAAASRQTDGLMAFSATLRHAGQFTDAAIRGYKVGADEGPWIDQTVRHTGVRHAYVDYHADSVSEAVDECLAAHDEPFQESDCVYSYLLHREIASSGYKVLLVGEGGDEVLGGYARLLFPYLYSLRQDAREEEFTAALTGAQELLGMSGVAIQERLHRYAETLHNGGSGQENMSAYRLLDPVFTDANRTVVEESAYPDTVGRYGNYFFAHLAQHIVQRDLPYHLRLTDRNAMAHGVEARPPMVDHAFMELVFSYDYGAFMRCGVNKAMLRQAMRPFLPDGVVDRTSKEGRPGNSAFLVYGPLAGELQEMLASSTWLRLLRPDARDVFVSDSQSHNVERSVAWFRVYVLMKWLSARGEAAAFS
jgi:asparagine synthase (glutamine-hydrolysing)